ncbi:endolytic transglycosylase MltG, partial [Nostoc sp. NIES-2111]
MRVLIPKGAGARDIAELLEEKRVVPNAWVFLGGAQADGQLSRLKAGEYDIPPRASGRDVAALIASGKTVVRRITFAEGLMSGQIATLLNAAEGLDGEPVAVPPEGSLLPDTYFYSWGDPRGRIVERATRAMRDTLAELWAKRAENLPLRDPAEALVLASIVERETGHADERGRVAAVFVNRLRRGMRLQADPTVAYGIDRMAPLGRPLSRADLDTRHDWNPYVIAGLPPTPIANPGRASIEAV